MSDLTTATGAYDPGGDVLGEVWTIKVTLPRLRFRSKDSITYFPFVSNNLTNLPRYRRFPKTPIHGKAMTGITSTDRSARNI